MRCSLRMVVKLVAFLPLAVLASSALWAAPVISSLNPTSGATGTPVTITGTGFGSSQGSSTVKFGSVVATVTNWSNSGTSITANVPSGIANGSTTVRVTVSGVQSNAATFTITNPEVTSLSINSAPVGQQITINGVNFGSSQGTSTVTFNGTAAVPSSWNGVSISVPVPTGATTGNIMVTVNGNATKPVPFMVTPAPPPPGVNFIQGNYATPATSTASITIPFPIGQNAGDMNVAVIAWHDTTRTINSVTDSAGNTYTLAVSGSQSTTRSQKIYYAKNIAGATTNAITVTFSAAPTQPEIRIAEYSGLDQTNPFDVARSSTGTSTTPDSGTVTTTNQNDLLIGADVADGVTTSPGANYTNRVITYANNYLNADILEDRIVTATGSYKATATLSASKSWLMQIVAFKRQPPPGITSLSPTSGTAGTSITITGTDFGATQGASTVTFNGTTATPTSWSGTSIAVPVPAGASTGNVVVTVGGQSSNGAAFTVFYPPSITGLSPTSGLVGTSVTITGMNFGAAQGTSTVTFNGTAATATSWSNSSIVTSVSSGASTGNVVVTVNGQASNGVLFTVGSQGSGNLQISSPADGTVVNPGQTITVTITSPTNVAFSAVLLVGEPVDFSFATSVPAQFSLSIPSDISCRQYSLTAFGTTSSGQEFVSPEIMIDVERSDSPASLSTLMPSVEFDNLGETFPVKILATFSDGSVLDVTESSNLVYSSSNSNIVSVDGTGMLTAMAVGNATVTATYAGSVQLGIPVVIPSQALDPSPSSLNFGNQILGTNNSKQIVLTNKTIDPMQIFGVTITGDYTETDNCISSSPIAPGSTCTVNVTFTPTMLGVRNGSLSVSQDFSGAVGVSLSGTGQ